MSDSQQAVSQSPVARWPGGALVAIACLLASAAWAFWAPLVQLTREWRRDDNYSVGALVPLAALYLLWHDRHRLRHCRVEPCWWGVGLILLGLSARLFGLMWLFESAERYGFVIVVAGLVLLVAGWQVFWRTKWILLFLFLMVPLPGRVHNRISGPLQDCATAGAVAALELAGMTVTREGHVMILNDEVPVAVAEACSGLRMLTAFVVVASTLAYLIDRPPWQKWVLVISSVPVAIFCNLVRLVVTALLFAYTSNAFAETFFHDFAGFTMMPIAIMILVLELWIMSTLVLPDDAADNVAA